MKKYILLLFVFSAVHLFSQTDFSLRYFGLTIHPNGDQTAKIQPHKLDRHAYAVANFGAFVSADHYFLYDQLAFTLMQGIFTDCSGGIAGFSHFGIRGLLLEKGKHRLLAGIGPMLYYRRDWNRFSEYEDSGFFHRYHSRNFGDLQYKVFWVAGEFDWQWEISDHFDFNAGFTPGFPLAMSFSAGLTWWPQRFTKKIEQPKIYFRFRRKKKEE